MDKMTIDAPTGQNDIDTVLSKPQRRSATLHKNEKYVAAGYFQIQVWSGVISIHGGYLRGDQRKWCGVYAPSTHPLPVIECLSESALVKTRTVQHATEVSGKLPAFFRSLWNDDLSQDLDLQSHNIPCLNIFQYLNTRKDSDLIRQHDQRGLSVPVLWTEVITKVCEPYVRLQNGSGVCMPKVFVIGLDWFEKATFCRNLINHMISSRRFFESKKSQHSPRKRKEAIFVLDLDSDSPEFTPPGQISLFECRTLLLGPESTHIATLSGSKDHTRIIRSHHTGVVDALDQQEHFRACVFDLLRAYDKLQSKAPMVIRGPPYSSFGRPQYTKDIEHLLGVLLPTAVVHIRATTPTEPHESTTMSKADASLSWHVLQPHSSSEEHLSRRELQDNCIYSHFHSNHQGLGHSNIWTFDPVALRTTVIWAYHSETPDVLGILYSEYPAPEDEVVTTFLDGCLLWVVLIEDEELVNELFRQVVRTRTEQLPQIRESTNSASPLPDPQKSSLIGMARLNSIDVEEHELDLCLPAPLDVLSKIETRTATGHPRIILIKDGSEVPDWLYTEQINRSKSHESSDDLLYEDNSQQSDGDLTLDIGALPLDYDTGLNESDEGEPYVKIRQADERVPQRWKPQRRFGRAPTA